MNRKYLFFLTIVGLLTGCKPSPPAEPFPVIQLLESPDKMIVEEQQTTFDLNLTRNHHILESGWIIDSGTVRPDHENPVLTLEFNTVRDRILRFTLESPDPVTVTGRIGDHALIPDTSLENTGKNEFAFLLPATFQTAGTNRIQLDIRPFRNCRLRAVTILEGAVRLAYAGVGEDIRHTLLVLPGATVSFQTAVPDQPAVLELNTGLDDRARAMGSKGGRVDITVRSGEIVQHGPGVVVPPDGQWKPVKLPLESRFQGKNIQVVFTFSPGSAPDAISDIIAVADLRITPGTPPAPTPQNRQSIILITLDTSRADRFGFGGDHIIRTPLMDRLSRMGHNFTDCICQINNTPPSHYTILTSKRPLSHGVYDMVTPLNPIHPTLPRLLKPAGYRSAAATSAAWLSAVTHGLGPGFERFYAPGAAQRRCTETFSRVRPWLEKRARATETTPFFTWLHFFDAHTPLDPPAPYDRFYYDGNPRDPTNRSLESVGFAPEQVEYMKSWMKDFTDINWFKAQYRSEISLMDHSLESLYRILSETGADRNTWVIITADHGISLDEHELYFIMAGMYEQQMHIPLLIIPPRGTGAAGIYPITVQSLDIAPTVMSIAGMPIPETFEGRNLQPLFDGGEIPDIPRVISEHANNRAIMVRDSQYKYVRYIRTPYYREPEFGLYDRENDMQETNNIYGTKPDIETRMDMILEEFRSRPAGETDAGAADSLELRTKLRALGYVE